MSGMVNTVVKNHFEVDLNFHPIRVIRFRILTPIQFLFCNPLVPILNNTSLNKFPVWHTDGTTVVESIWFLDITNLQTLSGKISWQSDVQFRSYRGFDEATFVIFKTMDKKEFRVLIKRCFLMGKNTVEAK